MSLIRATYHTITFPISDASPETIFALYRAEFDAPTIPKREVLVTLFCHALRDYLAKRLDEHAFGSLCFALVTDSKVDSLLKDSLPELRPVVWDCVDIMWLASSPHFDSFKKRLSEVLESLSSERATV